MAKLTTPEPFKSPSSDYSMPDASHAEDAKSRAADKFDMGAMSLDEYRRILAKANKILGNDGD